MLTNSFNLYVNSFFDNLVLAIEILSLFNNLNFHQQFLSINNRIDENFVDEYNNKLKLSKNEQ